MSDERGAVRSICDSRSKLFRGCQYTQSAYLRVVLSITGDIARGGKALPRYRKASVLARECRHQVILPQKKVVCARRAHQARSSPGATQKAGFLTSTDIARCGRWRRPPRAAFTRSSCVPQSNVYAGLMGSVEVVPRTLPMSPMGVTEKWGCIR